MTITIGHSVGESTGGAVGKALVLLEILSQTHRGMSLADIGRRTGLTKTTAHRLVRVLEAHGVVERDQLGFRLSGKARQWGDPGRCADAVAVRRRSMPHLVEMHIATGLMTSVAVLHELSVTYLESLFDAKHAADIGRTSVRMPAHCTAAGRVLLAHDPVAAAAHLTFHPLTRFTQHTMMSAAVLEKELEQVRRCGIAVCRGEYLAGVVALAVPIRDRRRRVVAALGLAGHDGEFDEAYASGTLRRHATEISASL